MNNQPGVRGTRFRRRVLTIAVVTVLLAFFSIPIAIVLYGGAAAAIGGLILIGVLIVFQIPVFMLLKRFGILSSIDRNDDQSYSCRNSKCTTRLSTESSRRGKT